MKLINHLPQNHQGPNVGKLLELPDEQLRGINNFARSLGEQASVDRATYSLSDWEKTLNIHRRIPDDLSGRRGKIKSRLSGQRQATKAMIIAVAESFSGGNVRVIERPEEFMFTVEFYGADAIPRDMDGFVDYLSKIKPAHLVTEYRNRIDCFAEGEVHAVAGIGYADVFELDESYHEDFDVLGRYGMGGGTAYADAFELDESYHEDFNVSGRHEVGANIGNVQVITTEG